VTSVHSHARSSICLSYTQVRSLGNRLTIAKKTMVSTLAVPVLERRVLEGSLQNDNSEEGNLRA
jgi:hypothetical protein